MPFGISHPPIKWLATSAICSFFREVEVYGVENVPEDEPVIFACSHANMAIDPAVLSSTVPHGQNLHYWVKDSLFKIPAVGAILRNAGNIAVDRKNKNNQKLFRGTFEALALNEWIGVFPEGTSHTQPHMIAIKDGTSWAALEYLRYLEGTEENGGPKKGKRAVVVPVGIAYVDKAKYRSRVVVHYGEAIRMDSYVEDFLVEDEAKRKLAVKRLTRKIDLDMKQMTVNAPDWDTAHAAHMARELLWEKDQDLSLSDYVDVSQTLTDLFTTPHERITTLKTLLATYHRLLVSSRLSNAALTNLPLAKSLDPRRKVDLPSRFRTLWILVKDSIASLLRFPFFFLPMLTHLPLYVVGIFGARLAEDEMETQAQMKVALGLVLSFLMYPVLFFSLWAVFRQVPLGAALAAGTLWGLQRYHASLIDQNYDAMKRLVAAWRLLVGVWIPQSFEMPLPSFLAKSNTFAPDPPKVVGLPPQTPPEKFVRPPRLPSRVLVRHVLRTRIQAARELVSVLLELEKEDAQVNASFWLAERYGGEIVQKGGGAEGVTEWERPLAEGLRGGGEVVGYLRSRGAKLGGQGAGREESHWAARSDDEGFRTGDDSQPE